MNKILKTPEDFDAKTRHKIYKRALEIYRTTSVVGLCSAVYIAATHLYGIEIQPDIPNFIQQNFPEIEIYRPIGMRYDSFWWSTHNMQVRIDILQLAIKRTSWFYRHF